MCRARSALFLPRRANRLRAWQASPDLPPRSSRSAHRVRRVRFRVPSIFRRARNRACGRAAAHSDSSRLPPAPRPAGPAGVSIRRFSTGPSSVTITTSALPGPTFDELDVLQGGRILLGGDHEPGAARQAREHRRRLREHILHAASDAEMRCLDGAAFFRRQLADLQHAIDEQTQAPLGRHPAGTCVRRIEQPHRFQIGHHVADGGGRQRNRQALGQRARAHRLARR